MYYSMFTMCTRVFLVIRYVIYTVVCIAEKLLLIIDNARVQNVCNTNVLLIKSNLFM